MSALVDGVTRSFYSKRNKYFLKEYISIINPVSHCVY